MTYAIIDEATKFLKKYIPNKALFLFIILLLGLISCSFLGGRNCMRREGFKSDSSDSKDKGSKDNSKSTKDSDTSASDSSNEDITQTSFYGPNGSTAKVTNVKGTYKIEVTDPNGSISNYTYTPPTSSSSTYTIQGVTFTGAYGGSATIATDSNGKYLIEVTYPSGDKIVFTDNGSAVYNPNAPPPTPPPSDNDNSTYPSHSTSANYYSSEGPYGGTAGSVRGPYGGSAGYVQGPGGSTYGYVKPPPSTDYSSAYPPGIPKQMIPPGQEDLYILKSEIVPPVCPACPTSSACPRQEKCPPCPACARCPEPAFDCKKVPNYNAVNNTYLPVPVLNDFSTFGM